MKVRKFRLLKRWAVVALTAYALGGCVTTGQLSDFATTEIARQVSTFLGQVFLLVSQGITGNVAGS